MLYVKSFKMYKRIRQIGNDSAGLVYLVKCKLGKKYVLKIYNLKLEECRMQFNSEAGFIVRGLHHPNIVEYYSTWTEGYEGFILMEYAEFGDVFGLSDTKTKVVKILQDVISALAFLHQHKIVHRDVKPENILVFKDNVFKLADFGYATSCHSKLTKNCGTLEYMCPQRINGEVYTESTDIFSLGALTLDLLCRKTPFEDCEDKIIIDNVLECRYHIPEYIDSNWTAIIENILRKKPADRLSLREIQDHMEKMSTLFVVGTMEEIKLTKTLWNLQQPTALTQVLHNERFYDDFK